MSNMNLGVAVRAVLDPSSDATVSMSSGNDEQELSVNRSPLKAILTVKKAPLTFSFLFVVPEKENVFRIEGLANSPLQTPKLSLPR